MYRKAMNQINISSVGYISSKKWQRGLYRQSSINSLLWQFESGCFQPMLDGKSIQIGDLAKTSSRGNLHKLAFAHCIGKAPDTDVAKMLET